MRELDTSRRPESLVRRYALPPAEIEARSLARVDAALRETFPCELERLIASRIVYAAGDLRLAGAIRIGPGAVEAGTAALRAGAPILTDVKMVLAGISRRHAGALGCPLHCAIDDAAVAARARAGGLPRAVEAMRTLAPLLDGSVVAIGNAPTALLSLLDLADAGRQPALVVGMPVGFVAAAEAKDELRQREIPSITITGTRGGSPLAAAAVNALLRLATPAPAETDEERTAVLYVGHGSRALDAAEAMAGAIERVRGRGAFPIVELGFLELAHPTLPEALQRCVEQGATRVLAIPYFLHRGMHVRRDIPALLQREAGRYPGLRISIGAPIGLHADLAEVMIAGACDAATLPDIRELTICNGACLDGGPPRPCCTPARKPDG